MKLEKFIFIFMFLLTFLVSISTVSAVNDTFVDSDNSLNNGNNLCINEVSDECYMHEESDAGKIIAVEDENGKDMLSVSKYGSIKEENCIVDSIYSSIYSPIYNPIDWDDGEDVSIDVRYYWENSNNASFTEGDNITLIISGPPIKNYVASVKIPGLLNETNYASAEDCKIYVNLSNVIEGNYNIFVNGENLRYSGCYPEDYMFSVVKKVTVPIADPIYNPIDFDPMDDPIDFNPIADPIPMDDPIYNPIDFDPMDDPIDFDDIEVPAPIDVVNDVSNGSVVNDVSNGSVVNDVSNGSVVNDVSNAKVVKINTIIKVAKNKVIKKKNSFNVKFTTKSGKALSNKVIIVSCKIKNKVVKYKIKTNKYGVAKFKKWAKHKVGKTYKYTFKFNGDAHHSSCTKSVKIKLIK